MKKMLIFAAVAVGIGIILALIGCGLNGFRLPTAKTETNTYPIEADFQNISVIAATADVRLLPAEGEACTAVCKESPKLRFSAAVENGTLTVTVQDTQKWYERLFTFFMPSVTVYLPQHEYGTLTAQVTTGDVEVAPEFLFTSVSLTGTTGDVRFSASAKDHISIERTTGSVQVSGTACTDLGIRLTTGKATLQIILCDTVSIHVSTGDTDLTDVSCTDLQIESTTGDVTLAHTIAAETIRVKTSTGDVRFDKSDGREIYAETSTGDVTGTLITNKVFFAQTSTGKIRVPKTTSGGRCEINTGTGNISIEIAAPDSDTPDEVFETAPLIEPPAED